MEKKKLIIVSFIKKKKKKVFLHLCCFNKWWTKLFVFSPHTILYIMYIDIWYRCRKWSVQYVYKRACRVEWGCEHCVRKDVSNLGNNTRQSACGWWRTTWNSWWNSYRTHPRTIFLYFLIVLSPQYTPFSLSFM